MHTRHGQGLQISEVILQLSVETRGEEHRAHVIADARAKRDSRRPSSRTDRPPRTGDRASLTRVGLDLHDLDGDLAPVRRGVRGLLALLEAEDRRAERRGLAVDVELGVDRDLAVAEQEDLFAAGDDRRDDGAGLDDAGALAAPR